MKTRRLGRTNFQVSILGVGGHTYPVGEGAHDFATPNQRAKLIAHLVAAGVNYFDTTWQNEVELLADSFQRAAITSPVHVSLQYVDAISDPNWRHKLRSELETRLTTMNYTRAPLFIMGVGNGKPPLAEIRAACEALQTLKAEGLIENIGVSCHDLGAFDSLASIIEADDPLDYLMIRYNWKFPQAAERLFPVAQSKDVGIVAMKTLCWDCGPDNWGRRISVFEPTEAAQRAPHQTDLNAAQRSLLWCLEQHCHTSVPSINARWEADQLLQAVESAPTIIETGDFSQFRDRLYHRESLQELSQLAESETIRQRAAALL